MLSKFVFVVSRLIHYVISHTGSRQKWWSTGEKRGSLRRSWSCLAWASPCTYSRCMPCTCTYLFWFSYKWNQFPFSFNLNWSWQASERLHDKMTNFVSKNKAAQMHGSRFVCICQKLIISLRLSSFIDEF